MRKTSKMGRSSIGALAAFLTALFSALPGCGAAPDGAPSPEDLADPAAGDGVAGSDVGTVESAIWGGDTSYDDEVVVVALVDSETLQHRAALCSGTLINSRVVLTAGHCLDRFFDEPGEFRIQIRSGRLVDGSTTKVYDIPARKLSSVKPCPGKGTGGYARHPNYTKDNPYGGYDFAVVVADVDIAGSKAIIEYDAPPTFLNGFEINPDGYFGRDTRIVGYGHFTDSQDTADRRRKMDSGTGLFTGVTGIFSTTASGNVYGAIGVPAGILCHGDSGGPLFQYTSGGGKRFVGTFSFGTSNTPGGRCFNGQGYYYFLKPVKSFIQQFGISGGTCAG
jgi:hypothetical protein